MIMADNPVDDDEQEASSGVDAVMGSKDEKNGNVSNFEKNPIYLAAFSAGVAVAFVGRRLLTLVLRRGML